MSDTPSNSTVVWKGYIICINAIIGSGILVMPWAYSEAGVISATLCQLYVSFLSLIVSYLILQTTFRMSHLQYRISQGHELSNFSLSKFFSVPESSQSEPLLKNPASEESIRFDLSYMVKTLLGPAYSTAFITFMIFDDLTNMAGMSGIFASSFASIIPVFSGETCSIYEHGNSFGDECWVKYWIYLVLFCAIISIPTVVGIKEQASFQAVLSTMRWVVIALLLCTSIISITNESDFEGNELGYNIELYNIRGVGLAMPVIFLCNYFQTIIPSITEHIQNKERNIPIILKLAIFSSAVIYISLGVIVPFAFNGVHGMVSVQWVNYAHQSSGFIMVIKNFVKYIVIMFPAIISISIFPIWAITLSDNIMGLIFEKGPGKEIPKFWYYFFRIIVCVLPVVISGLFHDLGKVLDICGTFCAIEIGFFVPLITIQAKKLVKERCSYDSQFFDQFWAWLIFFSYHSIFFISWYTLLF